MSLFFIGKIITFFKYLNFGDTIRIDASSMCQLKCPVCATWHIKEGVGNGYLKFKDFKKFVDRYPNFKNIELSNNGEIFLNPELNDIIRYSYEKKIGLTAHDGVNLNTISEKTIECLVKYRFRYISVSIDGASDSVYKIYQKGGDFNKVIENIKKINYYKQKYSTEFPKLNWKLVIFGHNEHEIPIARRMAKELNMSFTLSFNSDPNYSPVKNKEFIRTLMGFSSEQEWGQKKNTIRNLGVCTQLWFQPQINWDGRLLGCCCNIRPFSANVFESGLSKCLKSEQYTYAKKMLSGRGKAREDIPCFYCGKYKWREMQKCFVKAVFLKELVRKLFPKKLIDIVKLVMRNVTR